jgi:hypothetical protein
MKKMERNLFSPALGMALSLSILSCATSQEKTAKTQLELAPPPTVQSSPADTTPQDLMPPVPATDPSNRPPVSASPFSATPVEEWTPADLADAHALANGAFEDCHHWGGEEPYDEDRAKQIAEGQKMACTRANGIVVQARKHHPSDPLLAAIAIDLVGYLADLHGADALFKNDEEIEAACQLASDLYMDEKRSEAYARSVCPRR